MVVPFVGEICALLAALTWAFALIPFKRSGESIPPLSLSLFKNAVGIILLAITLPIVGEGITTITNLNRHDVYILILSGVIGIALADTLLFYSLNLIGVGLLAITECVYAPSVVLFAWLFLHEELATHHYIGGALILAAVLISSKHKAPQRRTHRELVRGILLGAVSVSLMGLGIVMAKHVLETTPLITASLLRLLGGMAVLALVTAVSPMRAAHYSVFQPSPAWRFSLPASVLGTYVAMIFWIAGFKYAQATIAAILNQTSTIIALILATLILKEPFTKRKAVAAVLALGGVLVVTIGVYNG